MIRKTLRSKSPLLIALSGAVAACSSGPPCPEKGSLCYVYEATPGDPSKGYSMRSGYYEHREQLEKVLAAKGGNDPEIKEIAKRVRFIEPNTRIEILDRGPSWAHFRVKDEPGSTGFINLAFLHASKGSLR